MTTPTFAVNNSITLHGVQSNWQRVVKRVNADGTKEFQPYAINSWAIATMPAEMFVQLQALQGRRFTALDTTDINDRNQAAEYTSGEMGIVSGQQIGRRAVGVQVAFRVDVS